MLTPHQVAARIGFGPIPVGATLLHYCEVRLCCRYDPHRHVTVGTQGENMRQAVARGRAVGPHPGRVDTRGNRTVFPRHCGSGVASSTHGSAAAGAGPSAIRS